MTIKNLVIEHFPLYSHHPKRGKFAEFTGETEFMFGLTIDSSRDFKIPTKINYGNKFKRISFVSGENLDDEYPPNFNAEIALRKGKFELHFSHEGRTYIISGENLNSDPPELQK